MYMRELHHSENNKINIYHSEITLNRNMETTLFIITEEEDSSTIKTYQVEMPKFILDRVHLTPVMKTFYWYCLN